MPERTPGIIVTYFPDPDLEIRLAAIAREISPVLVVDNTANAAMSDRPRRGLRAVRLPAAPQTAPTSVSPPPSTRVWRTRTARLHLAVAFDQDSTPEPGLVAVDGVCPAHLPRPPPAVRRRQLAR